MKSHEHDLFHEVVKALKRDEPDFELLNLHGRPVFVRPLANYERQRAEKCPDCGSDAIMAVFEMPDAAVSNGSKWYYCGSCCIGG